MIESENKAWIFLTEEKCKNCWDKTTPAAPIPVSDPSLQVEVEKEARKIKAGATNMPRQKTVLRFRPVCKTLIVVVTWLDTIRPQSSSGGRI